MSRCAVPLHGDLDDDEDPCGEVSCCVVLRWILGGICGEVLGEGRVGG
jgi:hypothetical protein